MSLAMAIVAITSGLLALGAGVLARDSAAEWTVRGANLLAWLGALAGAVGIYLGHVHDSASVLAVCGCAAVLMIPAQRAGQRARMRVASLVGALALCFGGASLSLVLGGSPADGAGLQAEVLVLYAAVFAATTGAAAAFVGASSLSDLAQARSLPAAGTACIVVSALVGVWWLGMARGGWDVDGWSAPLMASGNPLFWQVPDGVALPGGLRLPVATPVPLATALLAAGLASAVVAVLTSRVKLVAAAWGSTALSAAALVGLLVSDRVDVTLPDADLLSARVGDWLLQHGYAEQIAQRAAWSDAASPSVDKWSMLPELAALAFVTLVGVWAAGRALTGGAKDTAQDRVELVARDLTIRGLVLGWSACLLLVYANWTQSGYYGMGSPADVSFFGAMILMSGLGLVGWSLPGGTGWRRIRGFTPGLILGVLALAIVAGLLFNRPMGLGLPL